MNRNASAKVYTKNKPCQGHFYTIYDHYFLSAKVVYKRTSPSKGLHMVTTLEAWEGKLHDIFVIYPLLLSPHLHLPPFCCCCCCLLLYGSFLISLIWESREAVNILSLFWSVCGYKVCFWRLIVMCTAQMLCGLEVSIFIEESSSWSNLQKKLDLSSKIRNIRCSRDQFHARADRMFFVKPTELHWPFP